MKTLLALKRFDLAVQLSTLLIVVMLSAYRGHPFFLYYAYYLLGGAQVLSFVIHLAAKQSPWLASVRSSYGRTLAWLFGIAVVAVLIGMVSEGALGLLLVVGGFYLIVTPFIAAWYFVMCAGETKRVYQALQRDMLIIK